MPTPSELALGHGYNGTKALPAAFSHKRSCERAHKALAMMQMTDMPIGMMMGMGLIWILIIILLVLGIAALIKYLRS